MEKIKDERINKKRHRSKRKVNNKNSEKRPHIISAFYSNKMQDIVRFESLRENTIGKIVELSTIVDEYYAQSEEVPVMVYDSNGDLDTWTHIPDLLVYCKGLVPFLYQIKAKESKPERTPGKRIDNINKACREYARNEGWEYKLIYPFELDVVLRKNIEMLFSFRNDSNEDIDNIIKSTLSVAGELSIESLAKECESEVDRLKVLPVIYFGLAVGSLYTDLLKPITLNSIVRLKQESDYDLYDYVLELHDYSRQ